MRPRKIIRPLGFACAVTLLAPACSTRQMVEVAVSRSPEQAVRSMAQGRVKSYEHNPLALVQDVKTAKNAFDKLVKVLRGEAGKVWGDKNVVVPSNKQYVKYTQNYVSRATVNFDTGLITVETLDEGMPDASLRSAIVTTLLTPDDPRSIDLYSAETVKLTGKPYLHGLVEDHKQRPVDAPARAEEFADHLVRGKKAFALANGKTAYRAQFRMVSDHVHRQAQRYAPYVNKHARRFGISTSLIYAVMKTESAFNPFAVSSAPAYGLMQLVPTTGGRDAYRTVKGEDHTPSKEYLFDADHNIELGTAYLSILEQRYLGEITDPLTREYCTIAAYNGGAGNVFNLFSRDRSQAASAINALPPAKVYQKLRDEHPRDETRRYLVKVLDARKQFAGLSYAGN